MRVVIDTNVALSGLLWHGPPNQILKWARANILRILACEETIAELSRAVRYKRFAKRLASLELSPTDVIAYYMNLVLFVPSPKNIPREIEEDPFDNVFLALALEHRAQPIVSGDRHISSLKEYGNIQKIRLRMLSVIILSPELLRFCLSMEQIILEAMTIRPSYNVVSSIGLRLYP